MSEVAATQAFFAPRAAGWEEKFPDDGPAYDRAVADLAPRAGAAVLDAGCGTGRALIPLRGAVGRPGVVIGVDATREMLVEAVRLGRHALASLVLADVLRLPVPDASVDAVFAAGLVPHLSDPAAGLSELARVTRRGGRLGVFHPVGRAMLAARRGNAVSDADPLSPVRIPGLLEGAGWRLVTLDDVADRYLAMAERV
jgi:SAM-dependent methyltransferase